LNSNGNLETRGKRGSSLATVNEGNNRKLSIDRFSHVTKDEGGNQQHASIDQLSQELRHS